MPPIRIQAFQGIFPRVHPEKLSDNAAQIAHNVNLRRGVIDLLSIQLPFVQQHDSHGNLLAEIPPDNVIYIPQPAAPEPTTEIYGLGDTGIIGPTIVPAIQNICQPAQWLTIRARTWARYITRNGTQDIENLILLNDVSGLVPQNVNFSEAGCTFDITVPRFSHTFVQKPGGPYTIVGPLFEFDFAGGYDGGPDSAQSLPGSPTWADRRLPKGLVPLIHNEDVIGQFQAEDVRGPFFERDVTVHDVNSVQLYFPSANSDATYTFACGFHYTDPRRKHFYYLQTALTDNPPANSIPDALALLLGIDLGMEGPPSIMSVLTTLLPGQQVNLHCQRPAGYTHNRLYRSRTGGADFVMVADVNFDWYTDDGRDPKAIRLGEFGNYPASIVDTGGIEGGNDPADIADFLQGSVIHPAQFGVAYRGNNVWSSEMFKFWVWPTRWVMTFVDPVDAIALSIHSIVVFGGGKVFGLTGQHPSSMTKHLASETEPLLNKLGIAKVGHTVYYPTFDGLAGATHDFYRGLAVDVVTREYFTRDQWMALKPSQFSARVADQAIFMDYLGSDTGALDTGFYPDTGGYPTGGLRFDVKEKPIAVTTYDSVTPTVCTWKSKRFPYETAITFDYGRVVADHYPLTLTIFANEAQVGVYTVQNDSAFDLGPLPFAKYWEFQIDATGSPAVRLIELFDRVTQPLGPEHAAILTPEQVPNWRSIWLKFQEMNAPRVGVLTVHGESNSAAADTGAADTGQYDSGDYGAPPLPVEFYQDGLLVCTAQVTSRLPFVLPRSLSMSAYWRVKCETDLRIERLELFGLATVPVEGTMIRETHGDEVSPWRRKRYEMPDKEFLIGAVVHSSKPVTMNVYADGAATPTLSIAVPADGHVRLSSDSGPYKMVEFDFGTGDQYVTEAVLVFGPTYKLIEGRVEIRHEGDPASWIAQRVVGQAPFDLSCGKIFAQETAYPLTVKVWHRGPNGWTLLKSRTVLDATPFRLPMRRPERGQVIEIIPADPRAFIHEASFAISMQRLSPPLPPVMPMEAERG